MHPGRHDFFFKVTPCKFRSLNLESYAGHTGELSASSERALNPGSNYADPQRVVCLSSKLFALSENKNKDIKINAITLIVFLTSAPVLFFTLV